MPVPAGHQLKGVEMTGRRMTGFPARDVEPGHPLVAIPHRKLGDLPGTRRRAHRGQQHPRGEPGVASALPESLQDGLDDLGSSRVSTCSSGAKRTSA